MDREWDQARIARGLAFLKLRALEHRIQRRFDRCTHGGEVGFRLPLSYRLDCANRFSQ